MSSRLHAFRCIYAWKGVSGDKRERKCLRGERGWCGPIIQTNHGTNQLLLHERGIKYFSEATRHCVLIPVWSISNIPEVCISRALHMNSSCDKCRTQMHPKLSGDSLQQEKQLTTESHKQQICTKCNLTCSTLYSARRGAGGSFVRLTCGVAIQRPWKGCSL